MDPISDMLIMLKNGNRANHEVVSFTYSKIKHAIAECLKQAGYVDTITKKTKKGFPVLEVTLVYKDKMPRIQDVKRISKPSRRMYMGVKEITTVKNGHGALVLSTPKGILTDKEAKKELVGGEVLFSIW